ncbi:SMI1/KNR4 family protein [Pseudomonas entomophila]|uniref:SMI1/KNR4 family protein n=1 Tax=Pseudomonas entomophila TaxID=312306 RepID=UPI00200BBA5E|nr:SMI1/KNR4 family protein [Pseudomonas entomophila]
MKEKLEKLLSIGSQALGDPVMASLPFLSKAGEGRGAELEALLKHKNGFYAFAGALHVLPASHRHVETGVTLEAWNSPALWRSGYGLNGNDIVFFAEDLFGIQFCLYGNEVLSFDPETAKFSFFADSLEEWASKILADYDYVTGYSLGHAWQTKNGALEQGYRLLPKVPFVLGGKFEADNLYACDATEGMKMRGELAQKIKDLPDGAELKLQVGD